MRPPPGALTVDVFGNDGITVVDSGKLTGIDNQVDPTTGTLKLKAEFPNAIFHCGRANSSTCGSRSKPSQGGGCADLCCSAILPGRSATSLATAKHLTSRLW
jgi:hypothetical protein